MSFAGNTDSGTAITVSVSHTFSSLCSCAFKLITTRTNNERMSFIEIILQQVTKKQAYSKTDHRQVALSVLGTGIK
jgi:hypothetical protein